MAIDYAPPAVRRLRVYAFDPQAAIDLKSVKYAHAMIALPWEEPWEEPLTAGPVNDYFEVIDVDPPSGQFYEAVDLNHPHLLAQDGLSPSEGNPQFHQQMIFAVAMKTVRLFERALGRKVIWAPCWNPELEKYEPAKKLRIYPHALREANAYYSKDKHALLFGYFRAANAAAGASWIFTALSHDIIAHETTHAILDGIHRRYSESTSPDSLAFHEAFADIVALFSHFTLYEAVYDQIEALGGSLNQESLLSGLASQFASAISGRTSLRQYIDKAPDPTLLDRTTEPHDRGAILVAGVFDAFLTIYRRRTADLLRIGGVRPGSGQALHPDLTARLAREASKAADHVLRMCIRALDYMPPVDPRFGEFLRAVVTADTDLIPDDRLNYRLAFVEAFRRRGILPDNCLSISPDNLLWDNAEQILGRAIIDVRDISDLQLDLTPHYDRNDIIRVSEKNRGKVWSWLLLPDLRVFIRGRESTAKTLALKQRLWTHWQAAGRISGQTAEIFTVAGPDSDSEVDLAGLQALLQALPGGEALVADILRIVGTGHVVGRTGSDQAWEECLGLYFKRRPDRPLYSIADGATGPAVEVHSVRTTRRAGPDGQDVRQLVVEVTQKRRGYFDTDQQARIDSGAELYDPQTHPNDFVFRGGATLIIDLRENKLRYVIRKRIDDDVRLRQQGEHMGTPDGFGFTYTPGAHGEPFAMTHRGQ